MGTNKKSIILDLLYGKTDYTDSIVSDGQCDELSERSSALEGEVLEKLKGNDGLEELFCKFVESEKLAGIAEQDLFYTEGFKTGLLLGIEVGEWASKKLKY